MTNKNIFDTTDLEKKIESIWNFHLSHNQGVMAISEFKNWANKFLEERQRLRKEVLESFERLKKELSRKSFTWLEQQEIIDKEKSRLFGQEKK